MQERPMINFIRLLLLSLFVSSPLWAFPETIRRGYFSCATCHVSVTGGGVLNEYGRRLAEEFMATWAREGESDFLHGAVKLPESLSVGGDIRFLSIKNDNQITETQTGFPMQADIELAWTPLEKLTLVGAFGGYSGQSSSRRHYLHYQFNDNWQARAGRFYSAFGILSPDHSVLSRRLMGFDEHQENMNVEGAYTSETFEIVADVMLGGKEEGDQEREQGYSMRASTFIGERTALGLSYLHGEGPVWDRDTFGPFLMLGITAKSYLLSEVYYQYKKPVEDQDLSTPKHEGLITSSKAGYDLFQGFQVFVSFESADPVGDVEYVRRQRVYGPGIQWIPRPHFELYGRLDRRLDENYSKDYGYQALLVSHYWF
jgi:hypothetical protein